MCRNTVLSFLLNIWINNLNFYHFLQFTVVKPELITVVLLGTLAFKGCRRRYCFKAIVLSCQSKIQDGGLARRALGKGSGTRCYSKVRSSEFIYVE